MDNQNFFNTQQPTQSPIISPPPIPESYTEETPQKNPKFIILTVILGGIAFLGVIGSIALLINQSNLNYKISDLETQLVKANTALDEATTLYLELPEWNIRFKYPANITDIKYTSRNNYNGEIIITSITKDGVTYDASICGNKRPSSFSLGGIIRYNPINATNSSTLQSANQQIAKIGDYEYFSSTGNGCEANEINADFLIATNIIQDLFNTIEEY